MKGKKEVAVVGDDLEANCGVVLVPVGVNVEDFDAGMECGIVELLSVSVDDVGDGVAESW